MAVASPIVVGVRVRPFNQREARFQSQCIVGMDPSGTVRLHQVSMGKTSMSQAPREFSYDHAFWTHDRESVAEGAASSICGPGTIFADQAEVYEKIATPVLNNVMSGFNACLFAYGQTGSGKTYSMMGTPSDRGVLPRLGEAMFETIRSLKEDSGKEKTLCAVEASFCEIYNEKVRDLMASGSEEDPGKPSPNLAIRMDPKKGIFVEGLTKYAVNNAEDFYVFLEKGLSSRATASTNMNNTSSRSHAVVIIVVSQTGPKGEKCGKLCLVDLAGSERVTATGATGQTAAEGQSINLSLTQLGICLKRLAEQAEAAASSKKQTAGLPIPYRDSSLTFLLKENLGGNSKTAMLANISPASVNYDETLATLRFAQVARKVKSVATVNENPQTKLIYTLREELAQLKQRFQDLEARKSLSTTAPPRGAATSTSTTPSASVDPPPRLSETQRLSSSTVSYVADGGAIDPDVSRQQQDSPDLDVLVGEASLKLRAAALSADSLDLSEGGDDAAACEVGIVLDDVDDEAEEEIRSLEAIRHQTKSFVFHHHPSSQQNQQQQQVQSLLGSPSFRLPGLDLSRLSSVRFPPSMPQHRPLDGPPSHSTVSLSDPLKHDSDLDDLMADASHKAKMRSSMPPSSVGIEEDDFEAAKEINHSFASAQKSFVAGTARNVFLDSQKPQLIHLNPDSVSHTGVPLVMVLEEGENAFDIGGTQVVFVWDALANHVLLFGTSNGIAVNGETIEDEGTILRHRDRIVILGVLAFRFSYAAGVLAQEGGFNKVPTCEEHLALLEKYNRNTILLERSRDAMSIAKALIHQTMLMQGDSEHHQRLLRESPTVPTATGAAATQGLRQSLNVKRVRNSLILQPGQTPSSVLPHQGKGDEVDPFDMDDDDDAMMMAATPRLTPRNADPTLAAIGDDIALFNEIIYKVEVDLADLYPLPPQALLDVEDENATAAAYAEAIDEVQKNYADQEKELEWLRMQVHGAEARLEREATTVTPARGRAHSLSNAFGSPTTGSLNVFHLDAPFVDERDSVTPSGCSQEDVGAGFPTTTSSPQVELQLDEATTVANAPRQESRGLSMDDHTSGVASRMMSLDPEAVAFEQRVSDQLTTRIVQLELAYHRKVRALQTFARTGPKNMDDNDLWERLYTNPPFLGDPALQCEQSCYAMVRDHWSGASAWTQRFISSSRSFLYVFKKADGRERCLAAIYIPGATLARLNETDVEICPPCPRHAKDSKTLNPKDASLVLRFRDGNEHTLWREWFEQHVSPIPIPHHMMKRRVEERAIAYEKENRDALYNDVAAAGTAASTGGEFPSPNRSALPDVVQLDQICATANWKPDHSSASCERCSKSFSFFNRRHHCRCCGGIFCSECVEKEPRFGGQLACATCREEQSTSPVTRTASSSMVAQGRQNAKKQFRKSTTVSGTNYSNALARNTLCAVLDSTELPQFERLVEDFVVRIDSETTLTRVRVDHFQGRFHIALADDIINVQRCPFNGCRLYVRYKGSAASAPAAGQQLTALLSTPSSVNLGATSSAQALSTCKSLYFPDAFHREMCFESIVMLMSHWVFIDTLLASRMTANYSYADLVIRDDVELSLLRTTALPVMDWTVWVGVESSRPIPLHQSFAMYAILGYQETWSEKQLDNFGLCLLTTVRLGRKRPSLYIVVQQAVRTMVLGPPSIAPIVKCPGGEDVFVTAVGLRICESSLLFIASNHFEIGCDLSTAGGGGCGGSGGGGATAGNLVSASSTSDAAQLRKASYADPTTMRFQDSSSYQLSTASAPFSLKGLQMMNEPPVDLIQSYDHAFLVGGPEMFEFSTHTVGTSTLVQSRSVTSTSAVLKRTGRTWAQFLVPLLNFHASKMSSVDPTHRMLVVISSATYTPLSVPPGTPVEEEPNGTVDERANDGGADTKPVHLGPLVLRSGVNEVTDYCELWGNFGLDRVDLDKQRTFVDPSGKYFRDLSAATSSHADRRSILRTALFANAMPEYYKTKSLLVTLPNVGSSVLHMAALQDGVTEVHLEAVWEGNAVGTLHLSVEQRLF